jgi:hypothetical protein
MFGEEGEVVAKCVPEGADAHTAPLGSNPVTPIDASSNSASRSTDRCHPGKVPSLMSPSRSPTRNGSFMLSTTMVARPIGLRPTRYAPCHRECLFHLCRRG